MCMDTKLQKERRKKKKKKTTSEQKSRQQKFAIYDNVVLLEAFGSVKKKLYPSNISIENFEF